MQQMRARTPPVSGWKTHFEVEDLKVLELSLTVLGAGAKPASALWGLVCICMGGP